MKQLSFIFILTFLLSCRQEIVPKMATRIPNVDTLTIGDYILTFQSADSFPNSNSYGDTYFREEMTDTIGNWHNRAKSIEAYLKSRYGDYFQTTDTSLELTLLNSKAISFPVCDEQNDGGFNFEYYFKDIDYYVLRVQWSEGNCWMLVNRKNGYKKYISGQPYLSIEKNKILAINTDLYGGHSFNGIQLYLVSGDSLKIEFEKETEWGPSDVKWVNDNQFLLKREHFNIDTVSHEETSIIDYRLVTIEKKTSW